LLSLFRPVDGQTGRGADIQEGEVWRRACKWGHLPQWIKNNFKIKILEFILSETVWKGVLPHKVTCFTQRLLLSALFSTCL
jgi:hypothetical protein